MCMYINCPCHFTMLSRELYYIPQTPEPHNQQQSLTTRYNHKFHSASFGRL